MRGNLILIWPRLFDARTCSNKWPTNLIFTPGQNACNQVADDVQIYAASASSHKFLVKYTGRQRDTHAVGKCFLMRLFLCV